MEVKIIMEAIKVTGRTYAVRPKGRTGRSGACPIPWKVQYVEASTPNVAVLLARPLFYSPAAIAA